MSAQRLEARAFIWQNFCMEPDMVEARDLTEYKVGLIQDNIDRTGATEYSCGTDGCHSSG